MKGVCGGENQTKLKQPSNGVQTGCLKIRRARFIIHSSFFILYRCVQTRTGAAGIN
jgi:hypothetical protein